MSKKLVQKWAARLGYRDEVVCEQITVHETEKQYRVADGNSRFVLGYATLVKKFDLTGAPLTPVLFDTKDEALAALALRLSSKRKSLLQEADRLSRQVETVEIARKGGTA